MARTIATNRTTATSRTSASNRLSIQPMANSLKVTTSANTRVDTGTDWIGTGDITVCFWMKKYHGQNYYGRVISNGKFAIFILHIGSPLWAFCARSDDVTSVYSDAGAMKMGEWAFYSVTRNAAGLINFRVNGTASGTANQNGGTPAAGGEVYIGNRAAGDTYLNGLLKNLQVYNRILTNAEIDKIWLTGTNPSDYATSIIRDFSFAEGTGNTTTDKKGNVGTMVAGTWSTDVPTATKTSI